MRFLLLTAGWLLGALPATAQVKPPLALLALPAEDFSDWKGLAEALGSTPGLKLTLGLTPAMLTPRAREALSPHLRTGRLELAVRIPGDPILALVASGSGAELRYFLSPLALAREKFRSAVSTAPAGFVPAGGAAAQALAPALASMGFSWAAVGGGPAGTSSPPWLAFAPLGAGGIDAACRPEPALPPGPCALVLDESAGQSPGAALVPLLRDLAEKRSSWRWATVSEFLAEGAATPGSGRGWPGWGPDLRPGSEAAQAAWKAYQGTAAALRRYQNSGTADLKALEHAAEALYAAQAGRYYRVLAGASPGDPSAADRELRRHLMEVYRRMKVTVPGSLYEPFAAAASTAAASALEGEVSTDLRIDQGASWLSFQNPAGSLSRPPEKGAPAEPWKILGLRLDWDQAAVTFTFQMAALDVSSATASAPAGRLVLDAYVDINHVAGAGSAMLLDGRGAYASNRDAWEYALSLGPSGGLLLRAIPDAGPAALAQVPFSVDPARKTVRAAVPRSLLRGNPLRWGYIAASFAARPPARTKEGPCSVVAGGPLGLLAPVEQQAPAAGGRLSAVRLP